MSLEKKVAIVTGAAQGIGYAIAKRFLREKARVIIADVDEKAGQEAISALTKIGNARYVHCDVAQRLDVHNLVAGTIDEYGRIDVLVNNAGIVSAGEFLTLSEEEFDRVMAVNLKGAFLCSQAVARHMVNQVGDGMEAGSIINISSINAVYALADQVPYSVSKGGLNQLTRVAAQSLAKYGHSRQRDRTGLHLNPDAGIGHGGKCRCQGQDPQPYTHWAGQANPGRLLPLQLFWRQTMRAISPARPSTQTAGALA